MFKLFCFSAFLIVDVARIAIANVYVAALLLLHVQLNVYLLSAALCAGCQVRTESHFQMSYLICWCALMVVCSSLWSSPRSSSTFFVFSTRTLMAGGRLPSPSLPSRWAGRLLSMSPSVGARIHLQSQSTVVNSRFLISGCWQTLRPCGPEESWHWPQQEGRRADWGGGEELCFVLVWLACCFTWKWAKTKFEKSKTLKAVNRHLVAVKLLTDLRRTSLKSALQ